MTSSSTPRLPESGQVLDQRYRIGDVIEEGPLFTIFEAEDTHRRAPVAVKFVNPECIEVPGVTVQHLRGSTASHIASSHVVQVFDVGHCEGCTPHLVMELLDGLNLSELLSMDEAQRGLPVAQAVHIALQILEGLAAAHARRIIHRDLKPGHVFLCARGDDLDLVKLLDFSLSKATGDRDDNWSVRPVADLDALPYMAPERARLADDVDDAAPAVDLYSTSALLYEMLSGRPPHAGSSHNDLLYHLFATEPAPLLGLRPELPPKLCELVHRGLSSSPAARPGSALGLAGLLVPYADQRSAQVLEELRAQALQEAQGGA